MYRPNGSDVLSGNDRFEGFVPDLLQALSRRIGFRYEISLVPDSKFGGEAYNGRWNGMIGQLITRVRFDFTSSSYVVTDFKRSCPQCSL